MTAFIGRARELRMIEDVLAAPAGPAAAVLMGVAGSGKSRLLAEARRLAPHPIVLSVTGAPGTAGRCRRAPARAGPRPGSRRGRGGTGRGGCSNPPQED